MKRQLPLTPVLAVALVIIVAVGYLAVIKPKQDEGVRLDDEIAAVEAKLDANPRPNPKAPKVRINVADVFRLAKAMPNGDDMPGIIMEVNSIAVATGIRFVSIQPQTAVEKTGYHALPLSLTFEGNYYDLTDFLYRLRNLVTVRDGVLDATGRLYTLDAIDMHEGKGGFPKIEAVLTVSAYTFGSAQGAPAPAGQPATGTTQTTTGSTTSTGTTTPSSTPTSPGSASDSQQAAGDSG